MKEEEKNESIIDITDNQEYKELEKRHHLLLAEFDNFKRRNIKEKETLKKTAKLIEDLLDTLDSFDNASKTQNGLSEGIQLTYNNLIKTLEKHGVKSMSVVGEKLDSERMHPITQINVEDVSKKGTVLEEFQKGYTLGDGILRFPKVIIGI